MNISIIEIPADAHGHNTFKYADNMHLIIFFLNETRYLLDHEDRENPIINITGSFRIISLIMCLPIFEYLNDGSDEYRLNGSNGMVSTYRYKFFFIKPYTLTNTEKCDADEFDNMLILSCGENKTLIRLDEQFMI